MCSGGAMWVEGGEVSHGFVFGGKTFVERVRDLF